MNANVPRILVVGGKPKIVRKAKALDLEVLYFIPNDQFTQEHQHYVDKAILADYTDLDTLLPLTRALYEVAPFSAVVSLTEPGLVPAAHVNDMLRLGGNGLETVRLLQDKWMMRQRLDSLGISPVAAACGTKESDLRDFAARTGFPFIVKPVDMTASIGVFRVDSGEDLAAAWSHVRALGLDRFMLEEYLDGREMSVETFSFDGRHVVVTITDKVTMENFVEIGHAVPCELDDDRRAEVVELVAQFLDAVGLRQGPAHTEVRLTEKGPRIVESHNRVGGDKINELVEEAFGIDMDTLTLGWATGVLDPLPGEPQPRAGAAVRFLIPHGSGRVTSIAGIDDVESDPDLVELHVEADVGSVVPDVKSNFDRPGYVVARGRDTKDAVRTCERLASLVRIETAAADAVAASAAAG